MKAEILKRPIVILVCGLILGLSGRAYPVNLLLALIGCIWLFDWKAIGLALVALGIGYVYAPVSRVPSLGWGIRDVTILTRAEKTDFGWKQRARFDGQVLTLYEEQPSSSLPGSQVSVSGVLKEAKLLSPLAPVGSIKVVEERLVREPPIWMRLSENWRANLLEFLSRSLSEEERAQMVAFLFGDRQGLDPDQVSEIVDSGAIHLLSATGLPIIGILALFEAFGTFIPVPRAALLGVVTVLLIAFGLACGLHVSTVRTSGVLLVDRWSYLAKRTPDLISLAALMGIVVLTFDPRQVFNVGFALSLLAMMAYARYCRVPIVRRVQVSNNWKSAARDIGSTWVRTSAVMSLVALPILACFQHHISLSNILVLPLLSSYVPLLAAFVVAAHVLGWIYLPVGVGMLEICVRPLTKLLFSALMGTSSSALTLDIPEFSPYWLVPYFAALLVLGERYGRR